MGDRHTDQSLATPDKLSKKVLRERKQRKNFYYIKTILTIFIIHLSNPRTKL